MKQTEMRRKEAENTNVLESITRLNDESIDSIVAQSFSKSLAALHKLVDRKWGGVVQEWETRREEVSY